MKPKRLLFALFVLYWIGVYGVTFFYDGISIGLFNGMIPSAYKMYAPVTNTHYDVHYDFYLSGQKVKSILLSEYIHSDESKGIFQDKTNFAKSKVYEGPLKVLDFEFQSALYKKRYKKDSLDLNEHLLNQPKIQRIEKNLQNFAKLYLAENPNFKSDSVSISVRRDPMILAFQPDFKNDFTYEIGKGVFFKTQLILEP